MFKKRNFIFLSLLILGVFLISGCWLISTPIYTVTYDGNGHTGGSVPADSTVYEENDIVTALDKGDLVKTGYTFAGWNTAADGSGTDHAVGLTFIMGSSDVTLYAQWATNAYTVTFNSQGGSAVSSQMVSHGGKVTNPTNPTRTGYTFAGWYRESGCTTPWNFAIDTVTSDVTLYAQWTINSYTVTYNDNGSTGGSVPTGPSSYEYGTLVTVLDNTGSLVKTGYTFGGWNTAADGSGTDQAVGSTFTMGSSDVTLYAQWNIAVGASYGGGIVAYILQSEDPGYVAGEQHGLIAVTNDQSAGIQWYNGSYVVTGATDIAIGTGQANTTAIVNTQGTGSYAAQLCDDLIEGGYEDWFLPSKDELDKLYNNKVAIGGFADSAYWSSSESSASFAWRQSFNDGGQGSYGKNETKRVRAVRAF